MEPCVGVSRPPARLRRVVFPDPDGPITATSSPWWRLRLTLSSAFTSRFPSSCTRVTPLSSSMAFTAAPRRSARGYGPLPVTLLLGGRTRDHSARFDVVEPAQFCLGSENMMVDDERPWQLPFRVGPELRQVSQHSHRLGTLHLDHRGHIDSGNGRRERDLDHQFIPLRRPPLHRLVPPLARRLPTALAETVQLDSFGTGSRGGDEPVPLESLQGRVHLADIERPSASCACFELAM